MAALSVFCSVVPIALAYLYVGGWVSGGVDIVHVHIYKPHQISIDVVLSTILRLNHLLSTSLHNYRQ